MSIWTALGTLFQLILVLTFAFSAFQKARQPAAFERSLVGFALVPSSLVGALIPLVPGAEASVFLLLILGWVGASWGAILWVVGRLLSGLMLLIFSAAMLSVLWRGMQVECGCFGVTDRPITWLDLVRNAALMICTILSLLPAFAIPEFSQTDAASLLSLLLEAGALVLLLTNLDEVVAGLRSRRSPAREL